MYWAQKYSLFNKMKRPVPGTDLVNVTMFQLIICGGVAYSLGSLTWSNLIPGGIPKSALIPNLVALGISLTMILLPYNAILLSLLDDTNDEDYEFQKSRILLSSEYDRLNPDTAKEGFKDFKQYYEQQITELNSSSSKEKQQIYDLLAKQISRGHGKRNKNGKLN